MIINKINIRSSINKAFLKVKPNRSQVETFKTNLITYLDQINKNESEEYHKNIISDFLKNTYYAQNHYINTKGRTDLVIHNGKDAKSSVGVLIETKRPSNITEMLTRDNINAKAFHELVYYFMQERITGKNLEIKHLVATNNVEWFIFDATEFEKIFAKNKKFVKQFTDFEEKNLTGKSTDFFYNEVAKPFIEQTETEIECTYLDLRKYKSSLASKSTEIEPGLIPLYKVFSPEHLLKLPFANDSNTLDRSFYNELLYIIGLEETKVKSKKIIGRKTEDKRDPGSLIENAITVLKYEDCLSQLDNRTDYGESEEEQLYHVALELVITWINRVLFIKLLEGQLLRYHNNIPDYKFLNAGSVADYDELNKLFFHVLAVKEEDRHETVQKKYGRIPYLNSSLFEPNDLEHKTIRISNLEDTLDIKILSNTVLKDSAGKRIKAERKTLHYLFEFLDAYDFSSEGSEGIQEENKTLINASVLGLIFEKINGYKDGSYFTPGFITMYMCRETIRRAVVQKFNEAKGLTCETIKELYDHINNKKEANELINSLRICDPAVGSGHFLVSALNEIIAIKSELKILLDKNGKTLRDYHIEVVNDELVITDTDGDFFEYHPRNPESQRIQETLFHEKQTIIENCLFGVDINQNSVKICRLRLWIELLKNAYYKPESRFTQLETLPNIDINIKCGNSLISRYPLDADIKQALANSKWTIDSYRLVVMTYRNARNKEEKSEMRKLIDDIKSDFESEVSKGDKRFIRLNKLKGELSTLTGQTSLFEMTKTQKAEWEKKVKKLSGQIDKLEAELEDIRNNKIYEHAFEWRFEFPEVLNDDGDFVGFDIVISNPPYIPLEGFKNNERIFFKNKFILLERKYDSSVMFMVDLLEKLIPDGFLSYIAPITWETGENYSGFREYLFTNKGIVKIVNLPFNIFEDAFVETAIILLSNKPKTYYEIFSFDKSASAIDLSDLQFTKIDLKNVLFPKYKVILDPTANRILKRVKSSLTLGDISISTQGLSGSQFSQTAQRNEKVFPFLEEGNVYNYLLSIKKKYYTDLSEKESLIKFYKGVPKILIRRIISRKNRLSVAYTEEKMVFKKDINPFIPTDKRFNVKYLLALMASKLMSYLYINISSIATKDDFRQTTLAELRELPIILPDRKDQNFIVEKVKKILNSKNRNLQKDSKDLIKAIDYMIYKVYKLTDTEIQIIEEIIKD